MGVGGGWLQSIGLTGEPAAAATFSSGVCVCVCACVHACVCACVCVCVRHRKNVGGGGGGIIYPGKTMLWGARIAQWLEHRTHD